MKPPENLVKAVERLNPQAILLLDTNILMDNPRLESYEIAAPGPFLLVVPRVVFNELLSLTFNPDQGKKQKASGARKHLGELYQQGNPAYGIDLGNDLWLMTVSAPRPEGSEDTPLEDDQLLRYQGQVDLALLRLADACSEDISDFCTVFVTKDKELANSARSRGCSVCELRDLRSPEVLGDLLGNGSLGGVVDIESELSSLDPNEKRPVKVSMTLEELRSEGDHLIARGRGSLTYDERRHLFRWTYPYANPQRLEDWDSLQDIARNTGGMPVENLDFMDGNGERIPERVRGFACSMLESAGWADLDLTINATLVLSEFLDGGIEWDHFWHKDLYSLLSPHIRVRLAFMYMEDTLWGYSQSILGDGLEQAPDEVDDLYRLSEDYIQCCLEIIGHSLPTLPSEHETVNTLQRAMANMMAKDPTRYGEKYSTFIARYCDCGRDETALNGTDYDSIGDAYLKAHQAYQALAEHLDHPVNSLDSGLKWLLDVASDSWTVGQPRDREFTYSPLSLPEEEKSSD